MKLLDTKMHASYEIAAMRTKKLPKNSTQWLVPNWVALKERYLWFQVAQCLHFDFWTGNKIT